MAQRSNRAGRAGRLALIALLAGCGSASAQAPARARARAPDPLAVPPGNVLVLSAHAVGTQNYICLPSADQSGRTGWSFIGPQATLSGPGPDRRDVALHLLSQVEGAATSPEPGCIEGASGAAQYCPAWRSPQDQSVVWGTKAASLAAGSGAGCPHAGAVQCLLVKAVATHGAGRFGQTSYVRRLDTRGGAAPNGSCSVGQMALVPYTATYEFYAASP